MTTRALASSGAPPALVTDPGLLEAYARSSGPIRAKPAAVVVPRHPETVASLVEWAERRGAALIPRGAGTGMPGGNVGTGISIDLTGLDEVSPVRLAADGTAFIRAGAGAIAARVEERARAAGFFLPPLPSSWERCTVGGMVANNAAGTRTFGYGATRDWVAELDLVLAGGSLETVRPGLAPPSISRLQAQISARLDAELPDWPRVRKNSSGYALDRFLSSGDPVQLLLGSEGTLGIVTSVTFRLAPVPEASGVSLVRLDDLEDLSAWLHAASDLGASACEFLGRRVAEMARLTDDATFGAVGTGSAGLVMLELDGSKEQVDRGLREVRSLAKHAGTVCVDATDPTGQRRLWNARHRASPVIARVAERGLVPTQFVEDAVVPVPELVRYIKGVGEILAREDTDAVVFGHAGDGNVHVNPLLDLARHDWRDRAGRILDATTDLVATLGGTLSGEHGDGRIRAPLIPRIWESRLTEAFHEVKRVLDPAGIFNPGVIIATAGQDPLDGIAPWKEIT